jgi:hypothetical protein
MISYDHNGAAGGNALLIGRSDAQVNAHLGKQILQLETLRRLLHAAVEIAYFADWCEPRCETWEIRDARQNVRRRLLRWQWIDAHCTFLLKSLCSGIKEALKADEIWLAKRKSNESN